MSVESGRGGVELELAWAIRNRLEEAVKNFVFETDIKGHPHKAPQIINGYLPPKRQKDGPEVPFIIVRPSSGVTQNDGYSRVSVKLIIVTYSEEFDGYEYGLQVLQRVKQSFMQQPTLDKRYRFETPFKWEMIDDQPYPNWQIVVSTEWTVATPQLIPDEGVL